jgi:hypothetical protein
MTHSIANLPAALRGFAERHHIGDESVRSGHRLTLTVDKRYRIHLQEATHNRLAMTAQLMPMPEPGRRRGDELLHHLMMTATGMLREHPSTLAIDREKNAIVLQQMLASDANVEALEGALAGFTNALAFWSKLCAAESASL